MIAFVQPFGLHSHAGAPKLLRALLSTSHPPVLSINTGLSTVFAPDSKGEIRVPLRPSFGRLETTRLHLHLGMLDRLFRASFEHRLREELLRNQVELIHAIPHTYDIVPIRRVASELNIPYFLNIHDDLEYVSSGHPLIGQMVEALRSAWRDAKGIFVISAEMGQEYSRRYGIREYQVVTDGLSEAADSPLARPARSLRVYYMGLFHLSYGPNLRALLDALKIIRDQHSDWDISVTCRCGSISCPVNDDDVPVTVHSFSPDESVVHTDMNSADLLYQVLPFQEEAANFGKFSMSTKMVTYLGSGLPILYHGPRHTAACQLLTSRDAAVICATLDAAIMAKQLIEATERRDAIVNNALRLARSQFMLTDQQRRFWQPIVATL